MKTTNYQMIRFSSGIAAYRTIRLGIELFLLPWTKALGYSVGLAGNVYLVYSIASILTGVFFLYKPTACFGTYRRAWAYFLFTVGLSCVGFAAVLNVTSLLGIYAFAFVTGVGTAGWNLTYQAVTAVSFAEEELGKIAQFRQIFESIGFLLPSIALAVLANSNISLNLPGHANTDGDQQAIRATAIVLAIIAFLFHLISSDQVIRAVAIMPVEEHVAEQNVKGRIWNSLKEFFTTSIAAYFWLTALLLSTSNIIMALMSVITKGYLGISNAEALWIGAMGFPLGGIASVSLQIRFQRKANKRTLAIQGIIGMSLFLTLCIGISPILPLSNEKVSQILLFFFGFWGGFFFSGTYASSLTLWLTKLKNYSLAFNSQAAVINNLGCQGSIAIIFQLQTLVVQFFIEDRSSTSIKTSLVCFVPIIFILLIALCVISRFIPRPEDGKFGWPDKTIFRFYHRLIMSVVDCLGLHSKSAMAFSKFQTVRMHWFAAHLKKARVERGPSVKTTATLTPKDFEDFLADFDRLGTEEKWWVSEAKLDSILLDSYAALKTRLKLLSEARSTIFLITWCFDESKAGNQIADILIEKARAGIHVKVIVDEVTLYYQDQESKLQIEGLPPKMAILRRLVHGGVQVKMLCKWHKDKQPEYVIGTHRKMMLVDGECLLTGGRNISDQYFTTEGFHYMDSEVLLRGNFNDSTATFFETTLWDHGVDIAPLFPKKNMLIGLSSSVDPDDLSTDVDSIDFPTDQSASDELHCMEEGTLYNDAKNDDDQNLERLETSSPGKVTRESIFCETPTRFCDVSVFQLDHKSGDPEGLDIIFSSLLFMIDTATESIDLIFGYFQLFEELDAALTRAAQRGVKIRLVTNSGETNGLSYLNNVFGPALERLLELGAEIYTPRKCDEREFCFHNKVAIADSRAALVGSWN